MITIVNPPSPPDTVSIKDTMGGFGQLQPKGFNIKLLPLDSLYAAAMLRSKGIPVEVYDCLCSDWELEDLIKHFKVKKPEFVALRTSTPSFDWDMRVAHEIKGVINSKIIIFGPQVTFFPDETINRDAVDAVVIGEPEETLLEIAGQKGFKGCKGVWYKEEGRLVKNLPREPIRDLDTLPFPAWDLVPYQRLDARGYMRGFKPFVTTLTSRGCPHGCIYCPYPVIQGQKLRLRSPERVVDELWWLVKDLGVKAVFFRDPEFALRRNRVIAICQDVIKRKLHLAWRCETRIENLDQELVALMAKSGCIGLNIGIESADEAVLQNIKRKKVSLKQAIRVIKECKKNNIDTLCFFILGLPGDTKQSALKTIRYALKLNPTVMEFTVATPYPGTGLRKWAEKRGFIEVDSLTAMTGYEVSMRNEHLTADDIYRLQQFAYKARKMQRPKITGRALNDARGIAGELKEWLSFQLKLRMPWCKI